MSTPEQLQTIVPLLAAGLLAFALLLMLGALRLFRKSRKDIYWRQRRTAGRRGWRLFVWSVGLILVSGVLCAATSVAGLLYVHPTKTPASVADGSSPLDVATLTATSYLPGPEPSLTATEPQPTSTNTAITATATATTTLTTTPTAIPLTAIQPSDTATDVLTLAGPTLIVATSDSTSTITTPTMTFTETLTKTPTEIPSETHIPTATPTFTPTSSATAFGGVAPLESSVTPGPDARIVVSALDTQISGDFGPVKPATSFSGGFTRIYFFVNFTGMQKGVVWRRELLLNEQIIQSNQYLWGLTQSGMAYFFFGQEEGFKPGSYRINLYIGDNAKPTSTIIFTVS